MSVFKECGTKDITQNTFKLIGQDRMLISAGDEEKFNTMTASWGGLGVLWGRDVAFIFIRPSRYTFEFLKSHEIFTMSFFGDKNKNALTVCGTKSGRECDKVKEAGLNPVFLDGDPTFKEAELVVVCRKIYEQDLDLDSLSIEEAIKEFYSEGNVHKMFIGEIIKVYKKDNKTV